VLDGTFGFVGALGVATFGGWNDLAVGVLAEAGGDFGGALETGLAKCVDGIFSCCGVGGVGSETEGIGIVASIGRNGLGLSTGSGSGSRMLVRLTGFGGSSMGGALSRVQEDEGMIGGGGLSSG
jgi:hypothetical protein